MIRRPPRSTLFPYNDALPISRTEADSRAVTELVVIETSRSGIVRATRSEASAAARSEEHTSELQSRLHLVCRLLLEKKKTTKHGCDHNKRSIFTPLH